MPQEKPYGRDQIGEWGNPTNEEDGWSSYSPEQHGKDRLQGGRDAMSDPSMWNLIERFAQRQGRRIKQSPNN